MADLHNLLGDLHSDDENESPLATENDEFDDTAQVDRERMDLPPVLAEAERKQYSNIVEKEENVEDEDVLQEDQDYAQLKRLWKREFNTPELMPNDAETTGLLLELLEGQEETIDKLSNNGTDPLAPLLASIYKLDADRVRFMLTDLQRTRLDKIEGHALYMREHLDRMSDEEVYIMIILLFCVKCMS